MSLLITSQLSIGTLMGALIAAPIADKFGRRYSMCFWDAIFCVGAIVILLARLTIYMATFSLHVASRVQWWFICLFAIVMAALLKRLIPCTFFTSILSRARIRSHQRVMSCRISTIHTWLPAQDPSGKSRKRGYQKKKDRRASYSLFPRLLSPKLRERYNKALFRSILLHSHIV